MKRMLWSLTVAAAGLPVLSGCQTYVTEAGLTLPTPHYLRQVPTYTPPSPVFPLSKELESLIEAQSKVGADGVVRP